MKILWILAGWLLAQSVSAMEVGQPFHFMYWCQTYEGARWLAGARGVTREEGTAKGCHITPNVAMPYSGVFIEEYPDVYSDGKHYWRVWRIRSTHVPDDRTRAWIQARGWPPLPEGEVYTLSPPVKSGHSA